MKTKIKALKNHITGHGAFYALVLCLVAWVWAYTIIMPIGREVWTETFSIKSTGEVIREAEKAETPKEYMLRRIGEEGLSVKTADCILNHESRYNVNALGVNTNKSADLGYWQINSLHLKAGTISLRCMSNLHCSTEWTIDKVKNDGGWNAWSTYTKSCK